MSTGVWGSVFDWPVIGIQATLLPDGRVLSFGTDSRGQQGAMHIFDVWDPITNTHTTLEHGVHTDLFCSAAVVVPETGEVLIAGGDTRPFAAPNNGVIDVNSFDYRTMELHASATGDMTYGRWYPTAVTLANGKILVLGGRDGVGGGVATPEIYTPGVGWKTLDGATDKAIGTGWFYPTTWVASDGRVVSIATTGTTTTSTFVAMDASGNGRILEESVTPFKKRSDQPAIMFDKDKVLTLAADNSIWVVDFSGAQPKYTKTAPAEGGHFWSNMTLLADGSVLLTGGSEAPNVLQGINYTAATWHPQTGQWTYDDDAAVARLYHSSTLLLPDATVLSLGGGAPGPIVNLNGEIYKPGYLFNDDGSLAVRPKILDAPKMLEQREDFVITVDDAAAITELKLIKFGSSTHGFNPDSRAIDLAFTRGSNDRIKVYLPDNANVVIPGEWMLFAFNNKGTPSIAATIHVDTGGELLLPNLATFATLNGSASYNAANDVITLTKTANDTGNLFSNTAIDITKNFVINAQIKFAANDAGTGGISFVLHNDSQKADAVGYGGAIGGAYGISNGLAIEFDVSNDGARYRDIAADHTSFVDTDARLTRSPLTAPFALPNLEDGRWHTVQIRWNAAAHALVYTVDGKIAGALSKDIAAAYLGGSTKAFFGFTGATGATGSLQEVRITSVSAVHAEKTMPAMDHGNQGPGMSMFDLKHLEDCITLSGGARFDTNTDAATLTSAANKTAALMSDARVDLSKNFTIDFDMFFGTKDSGGDGMTFVLHNDPVSGRALGTGGDGLGASGIRYGVGIEFDTRYHGAAAGDILNDHTRFIDTDATTIARKNLSGAVNLGNIEDGFWHAVKVSWNATTKTLSYTFDGVEAGRMVKDISAAYLAGSKYAYFGFTAATGSAPNVEQVRIQAVDGKLDDISHSMTNPAMMLSGSAGYNRAGGAIQLTPDAAAKTGAVMSEGKIDLTHDFQIEFDIFLGRKDGGADGMAFVLHNDPRGDMALGTGSASFGAGGIRNGLGIEFDTYNQGALFGDITADHTNFFDTDAAVGKRNLTSAFNLGNKEDGAWHAVKINWDAEAHTMWYSVDKRFAGMLHADIIDQYLGDSDVAHFGVTGATGGAFNLQQVRFVAVDAMFM